MSKKKDFLLELVRRRPVHLTAEEIYLLAKAELPSISMATVYNNLGALAAEGKIRRIHIVGQADRYDRSTSPHEHMVCDRCGEIRDLSIPNFAQALTAETGEAVLSYELNIHYLCQTCREGNQ
jgi:Fe2+ or Zn2+ uptake regulation protein